MHDVAHGAKAARALNRIMAATLVVPALAPLLGSAILAVGDWRMIFLALAAIGTAVGVWVALGIPETRARAGDQASGPGGPPGRPRAADSPPPSMFRFVGYTAVVSLGFMSMYAYVSAAPFLFQNMFGFSPTGYALIGAGLSLLMAGIGLSGSRLIGRTTRWGLITAARVVDLSLAWLVAGSALVLAAVLTDASAPWFIAALAVTVAPVALISGSGMALAMDAAPMPGGRSSAIIGFTQALLGAAAPPLVGVLGVDARPMAILLAAAAVAALIAARLSTSSRRGEADVR
ncbi:hypothetical protein GCM10023217_13180 [Gordonia alkaliphila]|uniref:MFS transporter n=1 Tax=Gordonia alkaliphila TaxID=1053547 RepID=A0ABP8Z3E4_9ACTN